MINHEYKKVLFDIFDVLGFSESEKETALGTFKKKLAFELLKSVQGELPQDQQDWLSQPDHDMQDPKLSEIQATIKTMYSEEQLYEKSKPLFKRILEDYINFMSEGLSAEDISKLKELSKIG